jgi:hypothetical protein
VNAQGARRGSAWGGRRRAVPRLLARGWAGPRERENRERREERRGRERLGERERENRGERVGRRRRLGKIPGARAVFSARVWGLGPKWAGW